MSSKEEKKKERIRCPYCGKEDFDSMHEKGVHVSEEHVNENNIPRRQRSRSKKNSILRDWKDKSKSGAEDDEEQ